MRDPYRGVRQLTADAPDEVVVGRGVAMDCTVAGKVMVRMVDGSKLPIACVVGFNKFDELAVVGYNSSGTTATATVFLLA